MAAGELIMIGAYATHVVQGPVPHPPAGRVRPGGGGAGRLPGLEGRRGAERGVIRFLSAGRLETLLLLRGISLVLMQAVRSLFGAQNVGVENPAWMSGGWCRCCPT